MKLVQLFFEIKICIISIVQWMDKPGRVFMKRLLWAYRQNLAKYVFILFEKK